MVKVKKASNVLCCLNKKIIRSTLDIKIVLMSLAVMFFSCLFQSIYLAITSLLMLFIALLCNILKDFKNKFVFFFFLISFFVFTMSQYFFGNINSEMYYSNFSNIVIIRTIFMQYLSLLAIYSSFYLAYFIQKKYLQKKDRIWKFKNTELISLLLFIATIISLSFSVISNIDTAIRVFKYGYLEIYVSNHPSSLPHFIHYVGNSVIVFISLYLALAKTKKWIVFVLSFYFFNLIISIFAGGRSNFVIGIFYIIFYLLYYKYKFNIKRKVSLKKLILIVPTLLVLVIGLGMFNSIRSQVSIKNFNPLNEFNQFFVDQGRSVNLISYAQIYKKEVRKKNTNYVFGPLLYSFENKIEFLSFGNLKIRDIYSLNNQRKNNFAVDMTIYLLGLEQYEKGHGVGSQYIAELYIEYGYIGIVIFSLLLGVFVCLLNRYINKNWLILSILLLIFNSFVFMPRGQAMQIITSILSINFWGTILLLFIIDRIYSYFKKRV